MTGGGPFGLFAGEWTDDTAMSLALAETLTEHDQYDDWRHRRQLMDEASAAFARSKQNSLAEGRLQRRIREAMHGDYPGNPRLFERALMERFTAWMDEGAYSCNGRCFDIGVTVRSALLRWKASGNPIAGSIDPKTAGNGSLMRLAPVAIRYWNDPLRLADYAARQSRTTHGAPEAVDACIAYAHLLADAIAGKCASEVLAPHKVVGPDRERQYGERYKLYANSIEAILAGSWRGKRRDQIRASGYVVHSLEAALWCVGRTSTFRDAVLLAANLGEDADTPAAITGQRAGALYGASGIPAEWLEKLAWREQIEARAQGLFAASLQR
jgi:ADP-ribosyl-[dinitrogen reductase] hydrolase